MPSPNRGPGGGIPGPQYAGTVSTREELKAQVERVGRAGGHTLGPWLDVGHAAQIGCVACDRWAFVEVLPPPGRAIADRLEMPCPAGKEPLIRTPG